MLQVRGGRLLGEQQHTETSRDETRRDETRQDVATILGVSDVTLRGRSREIYMGRQFNIESTRAASWPVKNWEI